MERSESPDPDFDSRTLKKYKHDLMEKRRELEKSYQNFCEDPGSHPAYKTEWESFWKRKSQELVQVRIDPNTYNFNPEWKEVFYKYLKDEQAKEYLNFKKQIFGKYSRMNRSQWRDRRESNYESRYSRSSHQGNLRSRSRSKSRSHDRRRYHRRSRSRSRDSKKRVKVELPEKNKRDGYKFRSHTVANVCRDILKIDHEVNFKRGKVQGLMKKAMDFEEYNTREYTMTNDEYEYLLDLKKILDQLIKNDPTLARNAVDRVKASIFKINVLIKRWQIYKDKQQSFASRIKRNNNNNTFFNGKKFSFKNAGKLKTREETFTNRNRGVNYVSPWDNGNAFNDSPQSNTDLQNGKKRPHTNETTTRAADPEINSFFDTLKSIKKERADAELENLQREKKKLEELILSESKPSFFNINPSPVTSTHDSQELVIDESRNVEEEHENSMEEAAITAADITDEELVALFKDFETSSEEELQFVQQIMEELEENDLPRFNRLKIIMEEIQNSIELEIINFISTYDETKEDEVCIKQENVAAEG